MTRHTADAAVVDRRVRVVRIVLVWLGVLVIAYGAYTMVTTLKPTRIQGLAIWLLGAVILHDAILSPFVVLVGVLLRRAGRRLRAWAVVVIQAAVVLGTVLAAVVLPEIAAKHHGRKNPTVVPFDYVTRLVVTELVLVAVVVAVLAVAAVLSRRTRRPTPSEPAGAAD
jgi:MFS family permease